ncbi:MAG: class I SAM-dependent methyltransferase [Acidimicrobiia bacterium]|nr:class I SAM-dependent methyltransferase [Acidimicrobiia bacterium]
MDLSRVHDTVGRLRALARRGGGRGARLWSEGAPPDSLADWERHIVEEARPHTMTSPQRIVAAMDAVAYVIRRDVAGALVECGVWRGGTVLAMIRALQRAGVDDRDVYLVDTFEGMTRPTELDTSRYHPPALDVWRASERERTVPWAGLFHPDVFSIDSVRSLIVGSGYPERRIHFVEGPVEETMPDAAPPGIALLRLDTDWYDSTWHELVHLYPRVSDGGVLIVDDYGHWDGCRAAVDRYFREVQAPIFLSRIDYTGRVGVKVP